MATGAISETRIYGDVSGRDCLIVDDICDGGRTFIELAKEIRKQTNLPIYLIVTHGIFSAGFEQLNEYFAGIFCTNSIKDIDETNVKQYNVF